MKIEKAELTSVRCDKLRKSNYYDELFPIRFDREKVIDSIKKNGYQKEKPIIIYRPSEWNDNYEIIDGVLRWQGAVANNLKVISAFEINLTEGEARLYSIRRNLNSFSEEGAQLTIIQAIILTRELKQTNDKHLMKKVMKGCGISRATYMRAVSALNFSIDFLKKHYPSETDNKSDTAIVAFAVKNKIYQDFCQLYSGKIKPFSFFDKNCRQWKTHIDNRKKYTPRSAQEKNESLKSKFSQKLSEIFQNLRELALSKELEPDDTYKQNEYRVLIDQISQNPNSPELKGIELLLELLQIQVPAKLTKPKTSNKSNDNKISTPTLFD